MLSKPKIQFSLNVIFQLTCVIQIPVYSFVLGVFALDRFHDIQILDGISLQYAPNANERKPQTNENCKRNERKTNERFTRTI